MPRNHSPLYVGEIMGSGKSECLICGKMCVCDDEPTIVEGKKEYLWSYSKGGNHLNSQTKEIERVMEEKSVVFTRSAEGILSVDNS